MKLLTAKQIYNEVNWL